ncbi:hypothetical protein TELCIR_02844 [Teladorsagia circumcincta]|uniref:Tc1-like transposase DDE domain-containing protein n=1 Tax=Teladorsagia circumcincta TaxID=45464 RepID=A0A2G9UZH5_TELCI|nr:hypothetical protein TELCIR_02844 [Teladorsagia circumcincta]
MADSVERNKSTNTETGKVQRIRQVTWTSKSTSTSWRLLPGRTAQSGFIAQQDYDPKHKSKLLTQWFHDHNVPLLLWPSQFPDFNPIDDLWNELGSQVKDVGARYEHEDFPQLKTAWENVP